MRNKTVFLVSALVASVALIAIAACSGSNGDQSGSDANPVVLRNATVAPTSNTNNAFAPAPTFLPGSTTNPSSGGISSGGVGGGPSAGGGGVGSTPASGGGPASGSSVLSNSLVDRKIERDATLEITADDVPSTVAKIEAAAGAVGGFVSQETITQSPAANEDDKSDHHHATVQIRVPAESYGTVINQLRGLAKDVTSENTTTSEVTGQYTDLQAQLRNLQATEGQYLTLLTQASTVNDILTVQDRLTSIQGQIEQVQGQLQLIDNLTAMATITVNLSPPPVVLPVASPLPKAEPVPVSEPNWASEAWTNAWDASKDMLRYMGVAGITAAVVAAWLLIPLAAIVVGWRLFGGGRKPAAPST
jgi:hypothetical protein